MNFVIVTQGDLLYTPVFFSEFFSSSCKGSCKGIIVQEALGNKSYPALIKRMYSFYGLFYFLKQGFNFCFKKIQAKLYEKSISSKVISISNVAGHYGIPTLPCESVNTNEFKQWIKDNNIDLIISIAASEVFGKEILELPTYGCINFHNAPLPNYRGMLPNFWQMYHDEDYSVLTVHTMTEDLDRGKIIYQQKTKIKAEYSLEDLIFVTKRKSADVLARILKQFDEHNIEYKVMPEETGSYFTFPGREDVREFRSKGKRLL
jgi:methionyl-tRNA formyltransferase